MPELHGAAVIHERLEQPGQVLDRGVVALEAGRELAQQRAQLVGIRERVDAALEHVDVVLRDLPLVREILEQLQAELEAGRGALRP